MQWKTGLFQLTCDQLSPAAETTEEAIAGIVEIIPQMYSVVRALSMTMASGAFSGYVAGGTTAAVLAAVLKFDLFLTNPCVTVEGQVKQTKISSA